MDITNLRRAAAAAQAILQETDKTLIIDGRFGKYSKSVFDKSTSQVQSAVNSVIGSLGFPGGISTLVIKYAAVSNSDSGSVFDLKIVPSMIRQARARNVDPSFAIAQLVLESGGGRSTPLGDDGKPSLNYAGLKWNSVSPRTVRKATASSGEVVAGKRVMQVSEFAAFDSSDQFSKAYFDYLYNGPSSYRYKGLANAKTALEFGNILQAGGYATDPQYGRKLASVATGVVSKYALA